MISSKLLKPFSSGHAILTRSMSMWPAGYDDPIAHKNEINDAKKSGEYKKKNLVPIKAADPTSNCSTLLDTEFFDFIRVMMKDGKRQEPLFILLF